MASLIVSSVMSKQINMPLIFALSLSINKPELSQISCENLGYSDSIILTISLVVIIFCKEPW